MNYKESKSYNNLEDAKRKFKKAKADYNTRKYKS